MKHMFLAFSILLFSAPLYAEKIETILTKIDDNFQFNTQIVASTMIIHTDRGSRSIESKTWSRGLDNVFAEYLSPPREKGTKMLRIEADLWMYTPMADRTVKLSGHLLRQPLMGSDLSYEDFMRNEKLTNAYTGEIVREELYNNRNCWIISLTARQESQTYYKQKQWVDQERFIPLKRELYAKSGKLLKTISVSEAMSVGTRWYPKHILYKDELKSGEGTELILDTVQFNTAIPATLFSKSSLK